jgi:hypothetical protein
VVGGHVVTAGERRRVIVFTPAMRTDTHLDLRQTIAAKA